MLKTKIFLNINNLSLGLPVLHFR